MIKYHIHELIKKSGKPYRQLSKEMGVGYVMIYWLANCKTSKEHNLKIETVDKVAKYFGVKRISQLLEIV